MLTDFLRKVEQIDGIAELDTLLQAREGLRRVFGFLQDAYHATGNPLWLDYQRIIAGAGEECNKDLQAWIKRAMDLHGSNPDHWPGDGASDPAA